MRRKRLKKQVRARRRRKQDTVAKNEGKQMKRVSHDGEQER
jgi:hypothetical protein